MDIVLIILSFVSALVGLLGSVVPGLPGPPFAWLALLLINCTSVADHTWWFIVIMALAAVVITILDFVVPAWGAKKFGGSKAGIWGCNIGLVLSIIGLPFGPQGILGVLIWPFLGAYLGEMADGKDSKPALRAACGTFIGMLAGTLIKLLYGIAVLIILIRDLFV